MRLLGLALVASLALVAVPVPARADDAAVAEALYQEGRRLMEEGNYQAACMKLEESQRLDPGTGTLWHLARCYEKTGRTASAWAKYREAAYEARKHHEPAKVQAAIEAANRLEEQLSRLTVEVPAESRIKGLVVTRDGAEVGPGAWGTPMPVDRGHHLLRVNAPGHYPWEKSVEIGDEKLITVRVPRLTVIRDDLVGAPFVRDEPTPWYSDWVGWTIAGSGVLALAGGTALLTHSFSLEDDAKQPMDLNDHDRMIDRAQAFRWAGTIMMVAGAGAIAGGAIKLMMHSGEHKSEDNVVPQFSVFEDGVMLGIGRAF
jgi:hypothetical protein